eukprot:CAMPEP_0176353588 /NCGR_PEP_ID=MMETSP0126-20121128/11904_1 /TAXON_ID=141414 ORGANISM="Strombidinopsis acuminatum, Strain SPMC142" /NCGR_SAMPLE_ID=MMETSP0126 /ASSEMBLY_ACC=CAM_ASM_000229 /LENGTH=118 /DNA_ID=CAMNT_0017705307 /DNA_START=385 /DNA_END=741 /DNA_ORIENTATION=-
MFTTTTSTCLTKISLNHDISKIYECLGTLLSLSLLLDNNDHSHGLPYAPGDKECFLTNFFKALYSFTLVDQGNNEEKDATGNYECVKYAPPILTTIIEDKVFAETSKFDSESQIEANH